MDTGARDKSVTGTLWQEMTAESLVVLRYT
jgi:hypothetical protein